MSHAAHQASQECQGDCENFGGYLDITQFSDNLQHPLGRVKLVPGCRLEHQSILPNKFAVFLEKSVRMQKGDIVALTNEPA